jgi:hypothetical protein
MRWVVVEHENEGSYGEGGWSDYWVVGKVHGMFATEAEAREWEGKQKRGIYQPRYEVREISPVIHTPRTSTS